jgi:NTE family protein
VEGNHLLIDGGIFNNFPVDVMHTKFGGKIIGIDLKIYKEYQLNYDQIPGGWYLFFSRFFPFLKRYKIPGIASILMNTPLLASDSHRKDLMQYMEWYLNPPVESFGLLKMEQYDAVVKVGYKYAQEYLKTADVNKLYN